MHACRLGPLLPSPLVASGLHSLWCTPPGKLKCAHQPVFLIAAACLCRAQQHMEQTLDGMCVRVAHNHTFDGLWLRMANDFNARLGRPAVRVSVSTPHLSVLSAASSCVKLCSAVLRCAVLRRAVLGSAVLCRAVLCCAVPCCAVLCYAALSLPGLQVVLRCSVQCRAMLCYAALCQVSGVLAYCACSV